MHKRFNRGFSILELVVALAILSLLLSAGVTSYTSATRNTRNTTRRVDFEQIRNALEAFRNVSSTGSYPTSLSQLIPDFMAEIPRDPQTQAAYSNDNYSYNGCIGSCSQCSNYQFYIQLEATSGNQFLIGTPVGIIQNTTAPSKLACP